MIVVGICAAALFWIGEAAVHAIVFEEGSLLVNLVSMDANEAWMRSAMTVLILAFGVYAHVSVSRLKASHVKRARLHRRLEAALAKVLSGFIPICMHCKNIRTTKNDRHDWVEVEEYVQAQTDALFSHGLCPGCLDEHYPDPRLAESRTDAVTSRLR